ncbi:MAG: hypothetical protein JXA14_05430 [Anaerolineae bacterium]|nr:hypothetical protein [Anaerolineae bacterium]
MRDETIKYVVGELGKHRPENDIIRTVVYLEDTSWEEAKRIIAEIKVRCRGQIVRRQSPLLIVIGIGTFIGGFVLCASMVIATLEGFAIFFLSLPIPYSGNIIYFVTGLGMMAGGAYGTGPIVLDFLTAKDQED